MGTETIKGKILIKTKGNNDDALCIGKYSSPLAEIFDEEFYEKKVTVRYWISEAEMSKDELKEHTLLSISGAVMSNYYARYSECTGYLYHVEELQVGGHDLDSELRNSEGKYLYMEIDVY